ncbi:MAG: hypothetical protein AABZ47_18725 [Planctomycetota bacterium]
MVLPFYFLLLAGFVAMGNQDDALTYRNDSIGLSLRLPSEAWKLSDQSQGSATVLVFSPEADLKTRCSILHLPKAVLPDGLVTREAQLKAVLGEKYARKSYGSAMLGVSKADRLEYAVGASRTFEYGLVREEFYLIFQLAAPGKTWDDEPARSQLEAIAASFELVATKTAKLPEPDRSTSAEVRARRSAAHRRKERDFEVHAHQLQVRIDPPARTLRATDRISITSRKDDLTDIELAYSLVTVERVEAPVSIQWETRDQENKDRSWNKMLHVRLTERLPRGGELELTVHVSCADFFEAVDQQLVAEVAVVGQVREASSFSSHVAYYPIDEVNDAAVDVTFWVPTGYTAVGGGEAMPTEPSDDWSRFRYRMDGRRPRALPGGFAVGKYISSAGRSDGGMELTVHGFVGEEDAVAQRVQVAIEAANVFEQMMGLLPWKSVRIAHVRPERKETGVSLPGLILISDRFFGNFAAVDLSDGQLDRPEAAGLLVVVDELAHQWNFYATPLPNELAEGVSTFTNALFVEHRHGREAYRKNIASLREAYWVTTQIGRDVAIADPAIYETDAYRGIAFCKTAVVLDMLRTLLGDEAFFRGWHKVFGSPVSEGDGYDILQRSFGDASGKDLRWFFDLWFMQAGHPRLALQHSREEGELVITISQVQPGAPYRLQSELLVIGQDAETIRHPIQVSDTVTTVRLACGFAVKEIQFDPDELLLCRRESP